MDLEDTNLSSLKSFDTAARAVAGPEQSTHPTSIH